MLQQDTQLETSSNDNVNLWEPQPLDTNAWYLTGEGNVLMKNTTYIWAVFPPTKALMFKSFPALYHISGTFDGNFNLEVWSSQYYISLAILGQFIQLNVHLIVRLSNLMSAECTISTVDPSVFKYFRTLHFGPNFQIYQIPFSLYLKQAFIQRGFYMRKCGMGSRENVSMISDRLMYLFRITHIQLYVIFHELVFYWHFVL